MPLIAVANVLGHGDTRMVDKHYSHLSPSYIREAVRATALDLGPIEGNIATLRAPHSMKTSNAVCENYTRRVYNVCNWL
jgi:hypothetical protein